MKRSITFKIILSYMGIIIVSLSVIGIIFSFEVNNFVENQAQKDLQGDADLVAGIFSSHFPSGSNASQKDMQKVIRGKFMDLGGLQSSFMVV